MDFAELGAVLVQPATIGIPTHIPEEVQANFLSLPSRSLINVLLINMLLIRSKHIHTWMFEKVAGGVFDGARAVRSGATP
jgi:hypothetical protein